MFNKIINSTPFTGDTADRLFSKILCSGCPDLSFSATLRALLRMRLPYNETVWVTCKKLNISLHQITEASIRDCMTWFTQDVITYPVDGEHNVTIIHTSVKEAGAKMLEIIRNNAGKNKRYLSDYSLQEDLRVFYARKLNALFYIDITKSNTLIFTDCLELKHFHALQMTLPKYLPLLFENSLTQSETELLKSLGNKSAVEYENLLAEFAKNLDIRSEIIRTKLAGFETVFEKIRIDEINNEIEKCEGEYERHLETLRNLSAQIQEKKCTLAGLECAINEHSGDSEIMEYFMCNKNLTIMNVVGTSIEFVVHGYADVYEQEAFDKYVENHKGFLYSSMNSAVTKPQMEMLYRAIFETHIYKLRLCAAYRADMRSGLKAVPHYAFPAESRDYLPNPHIQRHGCIGGYAARFQEYMRNKDYVGAIEQAIVSARNLNFYDSPVMSGFARELSITIIKCIEANDGTLLTPLEAINELERGTAQCQSQ